MSMLGTLGKIAAGVMIAKTVGKAMSGGAGGGLLGSILGGGKADTPSNAPSSSGGIGDLINSFGKKDDSSSNIGTMLNDLLAGKEIKAGPSEEKKAEVLLYAMLNAAKADGKIDKEEEAKLTQHIGDASGIKGILLVMLLAFVQAGPLYAAFLLDIFIARLTVSSGDER